LITLSIVSHGQAGLVAELFDSIQTYCEGGSIEVVLTLNIPEILPFHLEQYHFSIIIIRNKQAKGFGQNHNAAFRYAKSTFFCVLNPDVRFTSDPFPHLTRYLSDSDSGVIAPMIINPDGMQEDNARTYPTPFIILKKAFGLYHHDKQTDAYPDIDVIESDWLAGMFLLFPWAAYDCIGGFDEKYFLYYEDVDLCARLHLAGFKVLFCRSIKVIHDARRESHRSFKYFRWHLSSMINFFCSSVYLEVCRK
jgi:N-acetylglucosaminyl-diphospho-decaprenol L-rhamnosyltransferase